MKIINQDLTKFSTIRTKSYAKYYCEPKTISELKEAISFKKTKDIPIVILGNGSNILFSKEIYNDILFIKLSGDFIFLDINKNNIEIGSGHSLKIAGKKLVKLGYEDFIFFNLIPATIGGAITQNAGTGVNQEIRDVCMEIRVFDTEMNRELILTNEECQFEYRNSIVKKSKGRYIVLSGIFDNKNINNDIEDLMLNMKDRIHEKSSREPMGYSFGSTFKNNSLPAWECVKSISKFLDKRENVFYSDKHYNWIINLNRSEGKDIVNLIRDTQKLVQEKLDIDLENEVTII